jgi:hypothetical protein
MTKTGISSRSVRRYLEPEDCLSYFVYQYSKKEVLDALEETRRRVESSKAEVFWLELVVKDYPE